MFGYWKRIGKDYEYFVSKKKLDTWPKSLLFDNFSDMIYYQFAIRKFMEATQIPDTCHECPLRGICIFMDQKSECLEAWFKIGGYRK